jgi:hypothetical protein
MAKNSSSDLTEDINMSHLTTLDELNQNINLLACVEESDAPFVSAYLNLENGLPAALDALHERTRVLKQILKGNDLADFQEALGRIQRWLSDELLPETKGVAIFVRGTFGGSFMLPMQFAAPLPNWIAIYPTPNIYHLVETITIATLCYWPDPIRLPSSRLTSALQPFRPG